MTNTLEPAAPGRTDTPETATAAGKAALAEKEYEQAIELFGEALRLALEACSGQADHPSTAQYYARYGRALLEAAVQTATVALVNQAVVEKNYKGIASASDPDPSKLIALSDSEAESDAGSDTADMGAAEEDMESVEEGDEEEEEEEGEEAAGDFDLAWEMLDAARVIYAKQEGPDARLHESQVLEDLADLSMETEDFAQASSDYQSALSALDKAGQQGDVRAQAALSFKLGMALEYSGKVPEAIDALADAHSRLQSLLESAPGPVSEKGKERMADSSTEELRAIAADVQCKLDELRAGKSNVMTSPDGLGLHDAMLSAASAAAAATSGSNPAGVNDLSSLVKKRKIEQ